MSALAWYLAGVATPFALVVAMAVVGCVERIMERDQ